MNTALLIVVGVVLAACCVQAKPQSADVYLRIAELKRLLSDKRAGGEGNENAGGDKPDKDTWPVGWMEFATLLGNCEGAMRWSAITGISLDQSILAAVCPFAFECAKKTEGMSKEDAILMEGELRNYIPILQCVNFQAVSDSVHFWTAIQEPGKQSEFITGTQPLMQICQDMWEAIEAGDTVEDEAKVVKQDLNKVEDDLSAQEDRSVAQALRGLLQSARKAR